MSESQNTLVNKFKRYLIHDRHPLLSTTEIMLSEEVRVFVRTMQRVNQTNYLDRLRTSVLGSKEEEDHAKVDFSKPLVETDTQD